MAFITCGRIAKVKRTFPSKEEQDKPITSFILGKGILGKTPLGRDKGGK